MLQDSRGRLILLSAEGAILAWLPPLEPGLLLSENGSSQALADFAHPDDADAVRVAVADLLVGDADTVTFVTRLPHEDGWRSYEATARNLLDEPLVQAIVVTIEDVTREKGLEERLAQLARRDELTGLLNRAGFLDSIELALARSVGQSQTGVFFVDIDDFRGLVQRVGAQVGDRLLMTVGERLGTDVRADASAARLGRDEFALLCESVAGSADATQIAKRIATVLSEPVDIDGEEFSISVSIGVALGSSGTLQAATLLRHAEVAMYGARRGRARYEIFRGRRRSPTGADRKP